MEAEAAAPGDGLRVGFVPGVTVTKWTRIWADRFPDQPLEVSAIPQSGQRVRLVDGELDLCFVRQPIIREQLHVIPLYEEVAVVVVPREHPATVLDEVGLTDLDEETLLDLGDTALEQDQAFDLVAGGAGVLIVPQAIARSHSRRDLAYVPVVDAEPSAIGLAWRMDHPSPLIEEFIGVVRGRTVNSSRTPQRPAAAGKPKPKKAAAAGRGRSPRGARPRRRS